MRRRHGLSAGPVTHVVLGQQARTELEIVIEIEGAAGLESGAKGGDRGGLGELLHAADAANGPVRDGGRHGGGEARGPTRPSAMMRVQGRRGRWSG